jgi:hypothetical protein
LAQTVEQAREQAPGVRVWAMDEHRIGLQPILRRVWAKRGQRPLVSVQPRYEWRFLHGFVEPHSGESFWWLTSWVDIEAFNWVLQEFALWCRAGVEAPVLLVLDQAGWHGGADVRVPPGITLINLPPYSPELQPAEHLWPLSNEGVCNQRFHSIQQMEDAQCQRCRQLQKQPDLVRSHTLFKWWP